MFTTGLVNGRWIGLESMFDIEVSDDFGIILGTGDDVSLKFNTQDANANMTVLGLPNGSATEVPVFVIGDQSVVGADLGTDFGIDYSGITEPRLAIIDADADSWVAIGFSADDVASILIGGSASFTLPSFSLGDDVALGFGDGSPARFIWETADANANCLFLVFDEGGAVDIPALVLGDATILNADLTWFAGVTGPMYAVVDNDGDSYMTFGFGNNEDDIGIISGGGSFSYLKMGPIVMHLDDIVMSNTKSIRTANATAGENFTVEAYDDGVGFVTVAQIMNAADPYISLGGASGDTFKFLYSGTADFGGAISCTALNAITIADDGRLAIGSSSASYFLWETADANANCLLLLLPEGGSVDVPAFIIGDKTLENVDLGAHNGATEPRLVIYDDDGDSWVMITHSSDDVAAFATDSGNVFTIVDGGVNVVFPGGIDVSGYSIHRATLEMSNTQVLQGGNSDNAYFIIKARDNGVGVVEVARVAGAADPYFALGGSQSFKFFYSDYATFAGSLVMSGANRIYVYDSGGEYIYGDGSAGYFQGNWTFNNQVVHSDSITIANAKAIMAPSATDNYFIFSALDTGVGQAEVARVQGAADPSFQIGSGGATQFKFYYSGYLEAGGDIYMLDDKALKLGSSGDAYFIYETADANANTLMLILPTGDATNVPIFVIGDTTISGADLTWFNGQTQPGVAIVDSDGDSAVLFGYQGGDDVFRITPYGNNSDFQLYLPSILQKSTGDTIFYIEGEGARTDSNTPSGRLVLKNDITSGTPVAGDKHAYIIAAGSDASLNDGTTCEMQFNLTVATAGAVVSAVDFYLVNATDIGTTSQILRIAGNGVFNYANMFVDNAKVISTMNTDSAYFYFYARDTGVGLVQVGSVIGTDDPYMGFGGSDEFKFYNSGYTEFNGNTIITNGNAISTTSTDSQGFILRAKDDGVGWATVAVVQSAANPYFGAGGASGNTHKFYYSGEYYAGSSIVLTAGSLDINDTLTLQTGNSDDDYFVIKARDNGVGRVEVARVSGAADPYFALGGSQEFKFLYSGDLLCAASAQIQFGGVNAYITGDATNLFLIANGANKFIVYGAYNQSEQPFMIKEQSAAAGDSAGYGQWWVKDDSPNNAMFTDDAGTDHALTYGAYTWVSFVIDGGGAEITTGEKGHFVVPTGTIVEVRLLADQSGSIKVDIWKDTYANFPPDNTDTITGGNEPEISAATKDQDSTLTSWTTTVSDGDILAVNVDSCTTIERCTLSLKIKTL